MSLINSKSFIYVDLDRLNRKFARGSYMSAAFNMAACCIMLLIDESLVTGHLVISCIKA